MLRIQLNQPNPRPSNAYAPKIIALQSGSEREMAQKLTSDIDRVRCLSWVIRVDFCMSAVCPVTGVISEMSVVTRINPRLVACE